MHRDPAFHISASEEPTVSDAAITEALQARLRRRVSRVLDGRRRAQPSVVRVSVRTPTIDPLRWLGFQPAGFKFYWHARGAEKQYAYAGVAEEIAGHNALDRVARRLATLAEEGLETHYVGGTRFQTGATQGDEWRAFGQARFVMPRFEMCAGPDEITVTLNLLTRTDSPAEIYDAIEEFRFPDDGAGPEMPSPGNRIDTPDRQGWDEAVGKALAAIEEGGFEKVVLARRLRLEFEAPVDPFSLLDGLRHSAPQSFHFLMQPRAGVAFLGAAPEHLFRLKGDTLKSEAVAGTRSRADDPEEDRALKEELQASEKDRREHDVVTKSITEALSEITSQLSTSETEVTQLGSKWHLRTPIRSKLNAGLAAVDVLKTLHPTPAVGGHPSEPALEHIAEAEKFDRGWYAAPIGRLSTGGAEFAVALRCGLVRKHADGSTLDLYSGAGIVEGSEPAAEWAEIEDKLVDFVRVLGLEA